MRQTISILLNKQDDSLVRLTGLFYRRGYSVESLAVVPAGEQGCMQVTAVVANSKGASRQLINLVSKLIDVIKVDVLQDESASQPILMLQQ